MKTDIHKRFLPMLLSSFEAGVLYWTLQIKTNMPGAKQNFNDVTYFIM